MPAHKSSKLKLKSLPLPLVLGLGLLVSASVYLFTVKPDSLGTLFNKVPTPTPITSSSRKYVADIVSLPAPARNSRVNVDAALWSNHPRLAYLDKSLSLKQLSQLVFSLQGVTTNWGGRTVPSVKSIYPLEVYVISLNVEDLAPGVYHYIPGDRNPAHQLGPIKLGSFVKETQTAIPNTAAQNAPAILVVTGNMTKFAKYFNGQRRDNDVYLEAGGAAQNLYLEAESLGLGVDALSSFNINLSSTLINLPIDETLIYMIPVGYPKE